VNSDETWKREKQLIVLTPDCFPTDKAANIYSVNKSLHAPTTVSIEAPFTLSRRHRAWKTQNNFIGGQAQYLVPKGGELSEASLSLFYEDSIALSSNAAAVQQFLQNESVMNQRPGPHEAPALDGLSLS